MRRNRWIVVYTIPLYMALHPIPTQKLFYRLQESMTMMTRDTHNEVLANMVSENIKTFPRRPTVSRNHRIGISSLVEEVKS